jgi:acyl-CoA synthetase (AMP-forming)/AMP-acid ligase II
MTTLLDRLATRLYSQPDSPALVLIDGDTETTFTVRQFLARAASYADLLAAADVRRGELVVLVGEFGEAVISAFWGALLLGAVPSIFPFLSDKLDPERYYSSVRQLVAREGVKAVMVSTAQREALANALAGLDVQLLDAAAGSDAAPLPYLQVAVLQADDIAFLQHSSGSTGLQKGVMLSHRAVINQTDAYSAAIALNQDDVIVSWLPLYHDMGLIAGFVLPLVAGVKLVLMSPFEWVRDPQILLHAIQRHRGTLCWQPNFAYSFLALRVRDAQIAGLDLSSWRAAVNCSEPVSAESHRAFLKRFAPYDFRAEALSVCYAMAENTFAVTQTPIGTPARVDTVDAAHLRADRVAQPVEGEGVEVVSCGRPIPGCEIRVVNEQRETLPDRQIGEIALRSTSMLDGYYAQRELSAAAIVEGWYHTGDMGYLADGELYVTGRKKDLIIVGGKNIYPQDIEALLNEIDGVHAGRVVAFGVFNDRLGTEDVGLVAEVDSDDPEVQADIMRAIRARVTQTLDIAVRYVHLVDAKWLVKTSSGKVARAANRDKFMQEVLHQG